MVNSFKSLIIASSARKQGGGGVLKVMLPSSLASPLPLADEAMMMSLASFPGGRGGSLTEA